MHAIPVPPRQVLIGDAAAFAAAVEALIDDPDRRRELSHRGRARAAEFDRRRVGPTYENLFARMVGLQPPVDSGVKSSHATST